MAKYSIQITKSAFKEIYKLPSGVIKRILSAIHQLADDPRPKGCKKLSSLNAFRIRIGQYRIVYTIEDEVLKVIIVAVGHRKDIYKK